MEGFNWGNEVCKGLGKINWYRENSQCKGPEAETCLLCLEAKYSLCKMSRGVGQEMRSEVMGQCGRKVRLTHHRS